MDPFDPYSPFKFLIFLIYTKFWEQIRDGRLNQMGSEDLCKWVQESGLPAEVVESLEVITSMLHIQKNTVFVRYYILWVD